MKGGAGQYFTPRPVIDAIVDCVRPQPGEIVADPACGTELVPSVSRPCGMKLYLHGIGPDGADDQEQPIRTDASLRDERASHADVIVPDIVPFEGGPGETVRRNQLMECGVHTLLRLPTGIFYTQGVKANVLFFDRRPGA